MEDRMYEYQHNLNIVTNDMSGLENLSVAVIVQAVEDYSNWSNTLNNLYKQRENCLLPQKKIGLIERRIKRYEKRMREVKSFFRSRWFERISGVEGKVVLNKLEKEKKIC